MIALIRKFINPRMVVREKILATKVGVCVLLEDFNLPDKERRALEEARDALEYMRTQYDTFSISYVRHGR